MKILNGGLENVPGFKFAAVESGIKYANRLDYAVIVSEKYCNIAKNRIKEYERQSRLPSFLEPIPTNKNEGIKIKV